MLSIQRTKMCSIRNLTPRRECIQTTCCSVNSQTIRTHSCGTHPIKRGCIRHVNRPIRWDQKASNRKRSSCAEIISIAQALLPVDARSPSVFGGWSPSPEGPPIKLLLLALQFHFELMVTLSWSPHRSSAPGCA